MLLLAAASLTVALVPGRVVAALAPVVAQLGRPATVDALGIVAGSVRVLGVCALGILVAVAVVGVIFKLRTNERAPGSPPDDTWGCGYAAPTARMQYTGRSFAELLAERLLPPPLRARVAQRAPEALFPREGALSTETVDPFTRGVYQPLLARWADRFARLRWLQQGVLHIYILYILVVLLLALGWMSVRTWALA
jgi:hypothetical protein